MKEKGALFLVGAGPGDPGLLTRRAAELLGRAVVVFHDPVIPTSILALASPSAKLIPDCAADSVATGMKEWAAQQAGGGTMVWLVPGDAQTGARVAAEAGRLTEAGIAFEIVPGVSLPKLAKSKSGPLSGRRIIVTRSREQSGAFSEQLRADGAEVLEVPVIKLAPPDDTETLCDAILGLHEYDWLVFTSVNGVTSFFDYFFKAFLDLRDIGGVRIAAVGPATAARLREFHLKVDAMPEEAIGRKVAQAMKKEGSLENLRVCLVRAQGANPDLPKLLEAEGAIVDDVACYQTVAETYDPTGAAATLAQTGADWITFTSGSTVEHFHARFDLPAMLKKFPAMRTASIGPETSKALAALSLAPDVEARQHTTEGLLKAIEKAPARKAPPA